ncbi:MAG: putative cytochrome oxidase assembly protein [Frankiales bacterium]|nr:putative cytochrome oxidase assembly protein [Frankiales bacterium]
MPPARPTAPTVRALALAAVVANSVLVVTGGAVRLTSSGLGCPTWPRCTKGSYVNQAEYGVHGVIEFSNRMLTFVLTAIVVALVVATVRQRPRRRDLVRLAVLGALGIPAQAVLGGVTVLTGLNPWTVMAHFLLSTVLIGNAVVLWVRTGEGDRPARTVVREPLRPLALGLLALTAATLAVGTVVTGSGPHSGDAAATRTGLDPAAVSQLHADLVLLLVGASVGLWVALRATDAPAAAVRAAAVLLGVELSQSLIGFVQYFTALPVVLVAAHLAGACLVLVAAVRVVLATRDRGPLDAGAPAAAERTLQPV